MNRIFEKYYIAHLLHKYIMEFAKNEYKELLNKELTNLEVALSKSRSIADLLKNEEDAVIDDELESRGTVLQKVLEIEEHLAERLRIDEQDVAFLNDNFSGEIQKIGEAVSEIQKLDSQIRENLMKRKDTVVKEMERLRLGQILPDQYQRHERGGPSFVNIKE